MWDIVFYIIVLIVGLFLLSGIRIIRPIEMGSIERLGRFKRVANQGITYVIPFIEAMYRVPIVETLVDVEPQEVITKDNLNAKVDAQVYYKVKDTPEDIKRALYKAKDFKYQIVNLARTTLRDVLGNMDFEVANKSRDLINKKLNIVLSKEASAWGIDIIRTEIAEITPPRDVQETMNKILKANNEKVAAKDYAQAKKTEAEGFKWAEVQKAEGIKKALILKAEGDAQAIKQVAEANAQRIKLVNESAEKYFKGNAQTLKKLETFETATKKGTKYIVPADGSLVNVISEAAGVTPIPMEKKR